VHERGDARGKLDQLLLHELALGLVLLFLGREFLLLLLRQLALLGFVLEFLDLPALVDDTSAAVAINLVFGLLTVIVGASGRFW